MAKAIKEKKNTIVINNIDDFVKKVDNMINEDSEKECEIKGASLKDNLCNYSYELLQGKTKGDTLKRSGVHIVHDDMIQNFRTLDVFMAHIDGTYKDANNQTPLSELEADEVLSKYYVSGFTITGVEENKSVILTGTKDVTYGSISFQTPKIKLEGQYLYIEELTWRLRAVIREVELYMDGKCAPQLEQQLMSFEQEDDINLEGAKVQSEENETEHKVHSDEFSNEKFDD